MTGAEENKKILDAHSEALTGALQSFQHISPTPFENVKGAESKNDYLTIGLTRLNGPKTQRAAK